MTKTSINSQSGSVLIQAMLGLGFVGLISYAVMNYQNYTTLENRTQFAQNDIDSAAQVLSSLAAVPDLCNSNIILGNSNIFVRPTIITDIAADQDIGISIGTPTTARPAWVDTAMGATLAPTSVPGTITAFNLNIDRAVISGAKFVRNTSGTNELWSGEIVISAQKPNTAGMPSVTGKRIIGSIEFEINAIGQKLNCSTSTSVASICRDLGGVYDALGVPNCIFALKPMDCSHLVDGYVHDIVSGAPTCQSATDNCQAGYFAAGITNGSLNCVRLGRRIIYSAAGPSCTGGANTTVTANAASPAGCYCPAVQGWNGTNCVNIACYWREERTPSAPCNTMSIDYGMDSTCGGPHGPTTCGSVMGPAFQCKPALVGSPAAIAVCGVAVTTCPWTTVSYKNIYHTTPSWDPDPFYQSSWTSYRPHAAGTANGDNRSAWYMSDGQSYLWYTAGPAAPHLPGAPPALPDCNTARNGFKAFAGWQYSDNPAASKGQWGLSCVCP